MLIPYDSIDLHHPNEYTVAPPAIQLVNKSMNMF